MHITCDTLHVMLTWQDFRTERQRLGRPFVVAHRGAQTVEPENTLAAFALALAQGADALETDLRFTRDDEIVLVHDDTLDRTTNGHGPVRDHTLLELRRFRTRRPGDNGLSDETIPTLVDLLTLTQARTPLLLELKDHRFRQPLYARKLIDTLAAYGMLESSAIVAFDMSLVRGVNQVYPDIPSGLITMWNPVPARNIRLLGPLFPLLYLNPFYVKWGHAMGAIVAPLDPNPTPRLDYYLRLQVDAVLADDPASVLQALKERTT